MNTWTVPSHTWGELSCPAETLLRHQHADLKTSSETCTAVEVMYSLSYLYQALGNNYYADRAELAAYNALPAQVMPDWWARQYMAEPNQPWTKNLSATPFSDVNTVGQQYTLEGNYPCCTVNHPQGYPKFLAASYVQVGSDGLAHALLAPANVSTTLKNGARVTIVTDTNYPFDIDILYTVTTDAPFDFYVRVPGWADPVQSSTTLANLTTTVNRTAILACTGSEASPWEARRLYTTSRRRSG